VVKKQFLLSAHRLAHSILVLREAFIDAMDCHSTLIPPLRKVTI